MKGQLVPGAAPAAARAILGGLAAIICASGVVVTLAPAGLCWAGLVAGLQPVFQPGLAPIRTSKIRGNVRATLSPLFPQSPPGASSRASGEFSGNPPQQQQSRLGFRESPLQREEDGAHRRRIFQSSPNRLCPYRPLVPLYRCQPFHPSRAWKVDWYWETGSRYTCYKLPAH